MSGLSIETVCFGVKFRSMLEARWAIFFNQMGISWEYEPERIQLATKIAIPDFFLPSLGVWFEVKPLAGGGRRETMWPDGKGIVEKTGWPFVLAEGPPDRHRMTVIAKAGIGEEIKGIGLFDKCIWCSEGIETSIRIGCECLSGTVFFGPKGVADCLMLKRQAKSLPPNYQRSISDAKYARFK